MFLRRAVAVLAVTGMVTLACQTARAGYAPGPAPTWSINSSPGYLYSGGSLLCNIAGWEDKDNFLNVEGGFDHYVYDDLDTCTWSLSGGNGFVSRADSGPTTTITAGYPDQDYTLTLSATVNDAAKFGASSNDTGTSWITKSATITLRAITVKQINWAYSGTSGSGNLTIPVGTTVDFTAVPKPTTWFPSGKPDWSGDVTGSGTSISKTFSTAGTFTVSASCGNTESITVRVVEVDRIQWPGGSTGANKTGTLVVSVGTSVTFTAVPNPTGAWPTNKPVWSGSSGASGTGVAAVTVTFGTVSSSVTDYKTVRAECGNMATVNVLVVEVANLTPDQGAEFDDGDGDANTKSYWLFVDISGDVTVTAAPNPAVAEADLPADWTLTGGTGTGKLLRKVSKTSSGKTKITCTAGTSKKETTIWVLRATVASVGFTGDHVITRYPAGSKIDYPDGTSPIWPAGATNDPVCYTKNTAPAMFAAFSVSPSVAATFGGISVRATVGGTQIGSAGGCKVHGTVLEDGSNTDGDVDGIGGGNAIPGSDGVKQLTPTLAWQVSGDGVHWSDAGTSGPITMYFTNSTPSAAPLYDLGLEKACGYVKGDADIPGKINTGLDGDITYTPGGFHHEDLSIFAAGAGVCCCHANVFCLLIQHVTSDSPAPTYAWGGCAADTHCHFKKGAWWGPTFRCDRPAHDSASDKPHFNFHAEVPYGGSVYDPSYGTTGWATFTEMAPVVAPGHAAAAMQQTGASYPPATAHAVDWTCPH